MKKLVVDASVCLKWVFEETDSNKARFLLQQHEKKEVLLLVPSLWQYEIINGFTSAVLRKKVSYLKVKKLFKLVMEANLEVVSVSDLLEKCLENANRYKISAYDSAYVTLAKENGILLVSADERLVRRIGDKKLAIFLGEIT